MIFGRAGMAPQNWEIWEYLKKFGKVGKPAIFFFAKSKFFFTPDTHFLGTKTTMLFFQIVNSGLI